MAGSQAGRLQCWVLGQLSACLWGHCALHTVSSVEASREPGSSHDSRVSAGLCVNPAPRGWWRLGRNPRVLVRAVCSVLQSSRLGWRRRPDLPPAGAAWPWARWPRVELKVPSLTTGVTRVAVGLFHCLSILYNLNPFYLHLFSNLGKEMAARSGILAWKIPWMEESGGLHTVHGVIKSQTRLSE